MAFFLAILETEPVRTSAGRIVRSLEIAEMKTRMLMTLAGPLVVASAAAGQQIIVDGVLDSAYGEAIAIQQVQTQFGNADLGEAGFCNGSEIDGVHAVVDGDMLYLLFTGNLESNFNKIDIFFDSIEDAGQNPILGNNVDADFNALNRMGRFEDPKTGEVQPGLTFDAGFAADFWMTFTGGAGEPDKKGGTPYDTYMSYADLLTGGGETAGSGFAGPGSSGLEGGLLTDNFIEAAIDNSNTGGVSGGDQPEPDGGIGVSTGIEFAIPLAVLGHASGDDIRICAFINGSGHDFLSNQVMGPLLSGGNLGEPRFVNFADLDGDQFVTVTTGGGDDECPGDLNGDLVVNGADFGGLLAAWGSCGGCAADLSGDGEVGGADVGLMLSVWGACEGGGGGETGCGDCNEADASEGTGCSDSTCESIVCDLDPLCCSTIWDDFCAQLADSNCDCATP